MTWNTLRSQWRSRRAADAETDLDETELPLAERIKKVLAD